MNMLILDWNMEDALAVRYEEGIEKGIEEGIEKGIEKGIEEGIKEGIEKGIETTARNALAKGFLPDAVSDITGLDIETIKKLM